MTGPEPLAVVTIGSNPITVTAARTGLQASVGVFIVQGAVAFGIPVSAPQQAWLGVALTVVAAWGQNYVECRRGRKLLGAQPGPARAS